MTAHLTPDPVIKAAGIRILTGAFAFTLVLVCCGYLGLGFFKSLDYFFYDRYMKTGGRSTLSEEIIIVDIDEASLSQFGQWPWPRYRLAQMLKEVDTMAPRAVALDILLPEPDRTALNILKQQFKTDFDIDLSFPRIPKVLRDNDAYLAQVLKDTETVGARYFYFDHTGSSSPCQGPPFIIRDRPGRLDLYEATGLLCNLLPFERALDSFGFTNSGYDHDGMLRRLPLLIKYMDGIYPHLSLALLAKAKGIEEISIERDGWGPVIKAGPYTIPVTATGEVALRFNPTGQRHRYLSAADLLTKSVSPSVIEGKIVLIGSSAVGLNDIHHHPFDAHFPGVEAQATLLDNILGSSCITIPQWGRHIASFICLCAFALMAAVFIYSPTPFGFFSGLLLPSLLFTLAGYGLFQRWGVFISPGLPLLVLATLFVGLAFARFILVRRQSVIWLKQLAESQQLTLEAMVSMVETRDPETGAHIKRTQNYAQALALYLKKEGSFPTTLTDEYIDTLYLSVPLHDIGKVGIPDRILLKEGPLTDEEFDLMKLHTCYGRQIIERATQDIEGETYLGMGAEIAGSHHEKWNGTGYPLGLYQTGIPLAARIMAICDVYDALISRRCYKPPFSHEKSMDIILEQKGLAFDPVIVDAFFAIEDQIISIASQFKDSIEGAPEAIKDIYMGSAKAPQEEEGQ